MQYAVCHMQYALTASLKDRMHNAYSACNPCSQISNNIIETLDQTLLPFHHEVNLRGNHSNQNSKTLPPNVCLPLCLHFSPQQVAWSEVEPHRTRHQHLPVKWHFTSLNQTNSCMSTDYLKLYLDQTDEGERDTEWRFGIRGNETWSVCRFDID